MNIAQSGEVEAGSPLDCATTYESSAIRRSGGRFAARLLDKRTDLAQSGESLPSATTRGLVLFGKVIYRAPPQRLSKLDAGSKGCAPSITLEPPVGAGAGGGGAGWTFAICCGSAAGAGD
jgi:hypothetical protein